MPKHKPGKEAPDPIDLGEVDSLGGRVEVIASASVSRQTFEDASAAIEAYLKDAQRKGLFSIPIPESNSEEFYRKLREQVAGTDEGWKKMAESARGPGRASADVMAGWLRKNAGEMPRTVERFVKAQIAAGDIVVTSGKKQEFFARLAAAADMSRGASRAVGA